MLRRSMTENRSGRPAALARTVPRVSRTAAVWAVRLSTATVVWKSATAPGRGPRCRGLTRARTVGRHRAVDVAATPVHVPCAHGHPCPPEGSETVRADSVSVGFNEKDQVRECLTWPFAGAA